KIFLAGPVLIIMISIIGSVITLGADRFIVSPNEYAREESYISRNIEATQAAYGLDKIVERDFVLDKNLTLDGIESNRVTIDNIPINDYRPTLDMFNSIQGFRVYYEFNDIDIDRYWIEDKYTQVFISAREMNNEKLDENALTWHNI